jgi:hypothetical protein
MAMQYAIGYFGTDFERVAPKLGASSITELLIPIVTDPNVGWRDRKTLSQGNC